VFYPEPGDYVFFLGELDLRNYFAVAPDKVIATNLYMSVAGGDTPFYKLPGLGGQNRMRGYYEGRFRDDFYATLQAEYRQYFWWRLGFVVFGGLGQVAPEVIKFNSNEFKYSFGAGLRLLFNKTEKVNLRVDLGFGDNGDSGIYFGLEEAF
jgi:hypothetical protein